MSLSQKFYKTASWLSLPTRKKQQNIIVVELALDLTLWPNIPNLDSCRFALVILRHSTVAVKQANMEEGIVGTRDKAVKFSSVPDIPLEILASMKTNVGLSVAELSKNQRVLLLFLTRIDCPHCQFNVHEFVTEQKTMLQLNTFFVLVHQEPANIVERYFGQDSPVPKFKKLSSHLTRIIRVADPELRFYAAFKIKRDTVFAQWSGLDHPLRTMGRIKEGYSKELSGNGTDRGYQRQIFVITRQKVTAHWEYRVFEEA
jgi:hypothetical protein